MRIDEVVKRLEKISKNPIVYGEGFIADALTEAITILKQYQEIQGSGVLPEKKEIILTGLADETTQKHIAFGYNQAISDITLRLAKALDEEKLERVILNSIVEWKAEAYRGKVNARDPKQQVCFNEVILRVKLAKAIREHVLGRGK